jgi:dTDP-glucose pyrophosphorylase
MDNRKRDIVAGGDGSRSHPVTLDNSKLLQFLVEDLQ